MWKSVLAITRQFMRECPRMLKNIRYSPLLAYPLRIGMCGSAFTETIWPIRCLMVAIEYLRINTNHDLHEKMTNHKSSQISYYTLYTNLIEFWICDSQENSDQLRISFSSTSMPSDCFPQFLFSLLMSVASSWGVSWRAYFTVMSWDINWWVWLFESTR